MYKVYLCINDKPLKWSMERCIDKDRAAAAFADLVNRTAFDVADFAAVLKDGAKTIALHRFTHRHGMPDYWRERIQEIPWNLPHEISKRGGTNG